MSRAALGVVKSVSLWCHRRRKSHRSLVGLREGEAGLLGGTRKVSSGKPLGLEEVDLAGGSGVAGREPQRICMGPSSEKELI